MTCYTRAMTQGHGTVAGYMRHRRNEEAACIECKAAWRQYYADLRAAKAAK